MSMNETPSSERIQIGFFGRRNAGKSSIINRLTGQNVSLVSDVPGTTADPVRKAMEIHGLGPCVIIDTAGLDDEGKLGRLRVEKTLDAMRSIDLAVIVTGDGEITEYEKELMSVFLKKKIPYIICYNKDDIFHFSFLPEDVAVVSALENRGFDHLIELIRKKASEKLKTRGLLDDIVSENDLLVLVIPMDAEAPKGRIILPQQMVMHEILLKHAKALICQPEELPDIIRMNKDISLVITDSQAFYRIMDIVPENIPFTSFSILMARYRGTLEGEVKNAAVIDNLNDGDKVLIAEGCTHRRTCGDIGSEKIPRLLRRYTGRAIEIDISSGNEFPENLKEYSLIIHCGACVLNDREMKYRMEKAMVASVPMTNYGVAVSFMRGILKRSIRMFQEF